MRSQATWRRYFRFSRRDVATDVEDEIAFHMAMSVEEHMRAGHSEAEARKRAAQQFGDAGRIADELREIGWARERRRRRAARWESVAQDLLYAARVLRRSPGFTAVAVLTLGLGIGANVAIFGVVDTILLRPLPYSAAERLVAVWPEEGFLGGEYAYVRERSRSFDELAVYRAGVGFALSGGEDGGAERVTGAYGSTNLFLTLGVPPHLGRAFDGSRDEAVHEEVVVLSHRLWQRRFGSDRRVLGQRVIVDGVPRTVAGVMPPGFHFPAPDTDLWVPLRLDPSETGTYWGVTIGPGVGRLTMGATVEQADAELRSHIAELRRLNPLWAPGEGYKSGARVAALRESMVAGARPMLLVLSGAVGLVLLIACVNVANLLLGRGLARRGEMAVRAALGASRGRVVRQLFAESLLLALLGGAVGVLLAFGATRLLVGVLPADTPRLAEVTIDLRVLGFAASIAGLTGLIFGLLPAWQVSRTHLQEELRVAGAGRGGASRGRLPSALVVAELALTFVLVIGAGLLLKSLWRLSRVDPGFAVERVMSARITPPEQLYQRADRQRAFHAEVLERVAALPGGLVVAATSQLPFDQEFRGWAMAVEGATTDPNSLPVFEVRQVTPELFRVLGIPLLRGRTFTDEDREGSVGVVVVDETLARQYWPGEDPIGKRLGRPWMQESLVVVGVVGAVKANHLAIEQGPAIYVPFLQHPTATMTLVARTDGGADALGPTLRALVAGIDPTVPVSQVRPVEELISSSLTGPRLVTLLLTLFAAVAMLLGAIGVYGVVAQSVQQRTREMGIRFALGARNSDVTTLVVWQGAGLALAGVALGAAATFGMARLVEGLLFEVQRTDPFIFALVPVLLTGVAVLASYIPARRAARVSPIAALRAE